MLANGRCFNLSSDGLGSLQSLVSALMYNCHSEKQASVVAHTHKEKYKKIIISVHILDFLQESA